MRLRQSRTAMQVVDTIARPRVRRSIIRVLELALLLLLLAMAGTLRLGHINWDQFQHVHPDERFIVWVADTISWPTDLHQAFDPEQSTINPFRWPPGAGDLAGKPRAYAYGHFPLYLLVSIAHIGQTVAEWMGRTTIAFPSALQPVHVIGRHLAEYDYLALVGRAISALCDLGTLLLVYALGRRAFGRTAGLLAACAYAFAVLPIQLSHFYAVDLVLTFSVVATVALAARTAEHGGWGTWLLAGAMAGLAVGSKFSAVLLAVPLLAAAFYRLPTAKGWSYKAAVVAGRFAAAAGMAFVTFALTNPFALIESSAYASNILAQQAMVSGVMDAPYTRQYFGTLPYLYFIQQLSQWGLGWPLGLAAWGGFVWLLVKAARRRVSPAQVVLLAWILPYFALTGGFHAKFLRYMAPLLPFILICGAGAGVAGYRWLAKISERGVKRWGRWAQIAWTAAIGAVMLSAVGWALTFIGVYDQEHPWIRASRWIYANVPEGSKLLTEHWDDALPLDMGEIRGGPPSRTYRRVELPLYDPDTPEKLDALVAELSTADYLILASNRLYTPIQRLPQRYPMSSQYYRLLFNGALGYQKVAEFSSYPKLGGLTVRDDHADESFTVYDHPRVMVFANADRLKPALLGARLGRYLPLGRTESKIPDQPRQGAVRGRVPGHALHVPSLTYSVVSYQPPAPEAPLTLSQPVDTLPVVADFRWNRFASEWAPAAVLLWWLILSLFGWLAWPLIFPLTRGLRDRGYGLARGVGWLLIGWVHWLGVSLGLWQNRTGLVAAIVAGWVVLGLTAWWVQRRRIAEFWAEKRRLLFLEEGVFALAFLAFVGIRILNPDLWQPWNGGEKFMESAFLNGILRSPYFPPYDPYFAGGYINYYYYGLYLVSLVIKLTGIAPEVAFNLAVPGLFALTAITLLSVGLSLSQQDGKLSRHPSEHETTLHVEGLARPTYAGLIKVSFLGVVCALLLGNLGGFQELVRSVSRLGYGLGQLRQVVAGQAYDYWAASRVIPFTINEFPFWSFLFADLHPHLIAMPFGVLTVGLAVNLFLSGDRASGAGERGGHPSEGDVPPSPLGQARGRLLNPSLSPLQGLLKVLLLVVSLGAMGAINTWDLPTYFLLVLGMCVLLGWRRRRLLALIGGGLAALLIGVLSIVAYWPFYAHYQSQVGRAGEGLLARYLGWTRAASPLGSWLLIWGIFLFGALSFTLVRFWQAARSASDPRHRRLKLIGLLGLIGAAALLATLDRSTAAIASVPLGLALVLACRRQAPAEEAATALLLALGLGIVAGTELIYVRDFLEGGEWYRMNTVFKFSMPAWLFLGLSVGVTLWNETRWNIRFREPDRRPSSPGGTGSSRPFRWLSMSWRVLGIALLAAGLVFLPMGIPARLRDRFPGLRPAIGTLDGTAYMTVGKYTWPDGEHEIELAYDYQAIHWLLDHVTGTPVLAEAPAGTYEVGGQSVGYDYYRAGGLRVASLTGFPTFVGQHQNEQRPGEQVGQRTELGQEFFRTTDIARARELMRDLRVGYVYVGTLERILFPPKSLGKFDEMARLGDLELVYQNPAVSIYRSVGARSSRL